ncbi:hypothetical protein E2C01_012623 [Portunus trituberculatus]|uniref:Uncharacterized protein n=1 Tax=Portunus trituberculatus TaxID=210409 RepID=A0A5B7DEQ9_PORTR|nr:hypothetical protein [Portunus trituberculatus]
MWKVLFKNLAESISVWFPSRSSEGVQGLSSLADLGKNFFLDGEDGARGVKEDSGEEVEEDKEVSVENEGEEEDGSVSEELRRGGREWLRRSWGGVREWT